MPPSFNPDPSWSCPYCFDQLTSREGALPRNAKLLREHLIRVHPNIAVFEGLLSPAPLAFEQDQLVSQPSEEGSSNEHDIVVEAPPALLEEEAPLHGQTIPIEVLPFELLPLESWDLADLRTYYRNERKGSGKPHRTVQVIDWSRIEALMSLKPTRCSVGRDRWQGYVVFEFACTSRVVLECPLTGNAIYIIKTDWRSLIKHSKGFVRGLGDGQYVKVVHKGGWLGRVTNALWR